MGFLPGMTRGSGADSSSMASSVIPIANAEFILSNAIIELCSYVSRCCFAFRRYKASEPAHRMMHTTTPTPMYTPSNGPDSSNLLIEGLRLRPVVCLCTQMKTFPEVRYAAPVEHQRRPYLLVVLSGAVCALAAAALVWRWLLIATLVVAVLLLVAVVQALSDFKAVVGTHWKRFERAVKARDAIIHHMSVPALVVRANEVVDANPQACATFGYDTLRGLKCATILPDSDFSSRRSSFVESERRQTRGVRRDGTTLQLVAHSMSCYDTGEHTVILNDISNELESQQKVLAQFVHEMRNKYTVALHVLEQIDAMCTCGTLHDLAHHDVKQSIALLQEADQLVRTRLELHRVYNGQYVTEVQTIDLRELMRGRVDAVRALASSAVDFRIELPREFDEKDVFVRVDLHMWQHIANNLLSNARQHTTSGTVVFGLVDVEELVFAVSDTGRGVSDAMASRLFTEEVSSGDVRGVGLGLVSCKKFAQAVNGDCWLQSTGDTGSEFRFRLPGRIVQAEVHSRRASLLTTTFTRVVIVEDSTMIRKTIRAKLGAILGDVAFDEYETVESALPFIPDLAPRDDVIFTVDHNLDAKGGVLTGSDLIARLANCEGLIVSVSGDDKVIDEHKKLGAHACLGKPLPKLDDIRRILFAATLSLRGEVTSR